MKRSFKVLAASAVLAIFLSGCFGSFGATRWLYGINDGVAGDSMGGKFVKTLVMWCFTILPAYELFMFADWLIINTIEFWVGSPIIGDASYDMQEDGSMLVNFDNDSLRFVPVDDTRMVVEHDGVIVGEAVKGEGNQIILTNFETAASKTLEINTQM